MDTSQQYIKMCERASPYYCPCWKWQHGDFAYSFYHKQVGVIDETNQYFKTRTLASPLFGGCLTYDTIIPLPRQDQLQEMIELGNIVLLWGGFWHFMEEPYGRQDGFPPGVFTCICVSPMGLFTSMEQLWLAFVMHEKYGKVWDGENWVKEHQP